MHNYILKSKLGTTIQINSVRVYEDFDIVVGEDGRAAIYTKGGQSYSYLPDAINSAGCTVTLEDCIYFQSISENQSLISNTFHNIIVISSDGVIAKYTSVLDSKTQKLNSDIIWQYEILKESSECYYTIINYQNNNLEIATEFNGDIALELKEGDRKFTLAACRS